MTNTTATWADELADPVVALARDMLPAHVAGALAARNLADTELADASNAFSQLVVLLGPETVRIALEPLLQLVEVALHNIAIRRSVGATFHDPGLLSFVNVLECCGADGGRSIFDARFDELVRSLIRNRKKVPLPEDLATVSLISLALRPERPPPRDKPRRRNERLDVVIDELALAVRGKGSAEDALVAWQRFALPFPALRKAHVTTWNTLLWAARVYYATVEKRPLAEVGRAIYDDVRESMMPAGG